jgi:hypothetical protein
MKNKQIRDTPEITVPQGYDLFDLIDTDSGGYDLGEAIQEEEVTITFE